MPASQYGGLDLIPDQSICDLRWKKWHCNRFFSKYIGFPLHHSSSAPYSYFIHLSRMLYVINNWQCHYIKCLSLSVPMNWNAPYFPEFPMLLFPFFPGCLVCILFTQLLMMVMSQFLLVTNFSGWWIKARGS
jgi:hypothetical protein